MKRALVMISAACLAFALGAGCKKKDGAGGGGGDMTVEQACDKTIAMMKSMADAVESSKGDCDKLGTSLEKWAANNKSFIEWAKKQDQDEKQKKEFEEKCEPKMKDVMEKVGASMMGAAACADNEKVKKALESFGS